MQELVRRTYRNRIGLVVVLLASAGVARPALAQAEVRSLRTEGEFVAFDAAAHTIRVRVTDPGTGAEAKDLKVGQEALFKVKPEGSVLSRTTVQIQGAKAELGEIPAGRTVDVYWRPDETDPGARFARKIDVVSPDEQPGKRSGTR